MAIGNGVFAALLLAIVLLPAQARGMDMDDSHDMMSDEVEDWGGRDDAAFLSGMIAHHRGAVDMSEAVLAANPEARVRQWAEAIIAAQKDEIAKMESLLPAVGGPDREAETMMAEEMRHMMEMEMSDDPGINFVMMMIPHHAGAIDMSLAPLVYSDNAEIRTLARDIIAAQAGEIYEFRQWLAEKGVPAGSSAH